jgi:hypothetical protein
MAIRPRLINRGDERERRGRRNEIVVVGRERKME